MQKIKILVAVLAAFSLFTSCNSAKDVLNEVFDKSEYIEAKLDGVYAKFNNDLSKATNPKVINVYNSTLNSINISMYSAVDLSSSSNLGNFGIVIANINLDGITLPFNTTAATNFLNTYPSLNYVDKTGKIFAALAKPSDALPYVTLQITSKKDDFVEGTFSGIMYDSQTTNTKITVTEGKFRIQLTR